mmetsp:Transcript_22233/g.62341  ORF Transcript_22233/g.62341 Transcript_22233/m.62341 type:complete len:230 (-) Transcript_22233:446-1135(-)
MPSNFTPCFLAMSSCRKSMLVASSGGRRASDGRNVALCNLLPVTRSTSSSPSRRNSYFSVRANKPLGSTEAPLPLKYVPPSSSSPSTNSVPRRPTNPVTCSSVISAVGSTVYSTSPFTTRPPDFLADATQESQSNTQRALQPAPSQTPSKRVSEPEASPSSSNPGSSVACIFWLTPPKAVPCTSDAPTKRPKRSLNSGVTKLVVKPLSSMRVTCAGSPLAVNTRASTKS